MPGKTTLSSNSIEEAASLDSIPSRVEQPSIITASLWIIGTALIWLFSFYLVHHFLTGLSLNRDDSLLLTHLICFSVSCPVLLSLSFIRIEGGWLFILTIVAVLLNILLVWHSQWALSGVIMLIACGLGGICFSSGIKQLLTLFIVVVLVGMIDVIGVSFFVVTQKVIESPHLLHMLCVHFPQVGTTDIRPIIGFADFLFYSLFFHCARRFRMRVSATGIALFVGLLAALITAYFAQLIVVSVLPFMTIGFLWVNWEYFPRNRQFMVQAAKVICLFSTVFLIVALISF